MNQHEPFMRIALEQARLAAQEGEIPVGACIVREGEVIALGRNSRERCRDPLGHAEINAIREAAQALGSWRLDGCTARISRVVYGARDEKAGSLGSLCDLSAMPYPAVPYVNAGVLEQECARLLQHFFERLRNNRGPASPDNTGC